MEALYDIGVDLYPLIQFLIFVGFFTFSLFCIKWYDDEKVKKLFVIALIIGMLVPAISGFMFPPFNTFDKFTDPAPETSTGYSTTVVDNNGVEYNFPASATPPTTPNGYFSGQINNERYPSKDKMACYLLHEAVEYRESVDGDGLPLSDRIRRAVPLFQRLLGRSPSWGSSFSSSSPEGMTKIQKLRIYRITKRSSSDGLKIVDQHRTLAYEHDISDCET